NSCGERSRASNTENGDSDQKHDQNRHHKSTYPLDSAFYAECYDNRCNDQEDQQIQDRLFCLPDKSGEEIIGCCRMNLSLEGYGHIFGHPSADDAVIWENNKRNKAGQITDKGILFVKMSKRVDRAGTGSSSKGNFRNH